jgi:amiloride-sensitive sodium channel
MIGQASMPEVKVNQYPLKVSLNDRSSFQIRLVEPTKLIDQCRQLRFMVHSPDILPLTIPYREFDLATESVNVEVTPVVTQTDSTLKSLSPIERGCFFEGEKKLEYFKTYTQKYCEMECIMDYAVDSCICQMNEFVYGPKPNFDFCFGKRFHCVASLESFHYATKSIVLQDNCTCLPLCNSIDYHFKYYPADGGDGNETIITIKLNTEDMILYRRYLQFTFSDALSYVGGILGLLAGVSILSMVELFYYFTLRTVSDVLRRFRINSSSITIKM